MYRDQFVILPGCHVIDEQGRVLPKHPDTGFGHPESSATRAGLRILGWLVMEITRFGSVKVRAWDLSRIAEPAALAACEWIAKGGSVASRFTVVELQSGDTEFLDAEQAISRLLGIGGLSATGAEWIDDTGRVVRPSQAAVSDLRRIAGDGGRCALRAGWASWERLDDRRRRESARVFGDPAASWRVSFDAARVTDTALRICLERVMSCIGNDGSSIWVRFGVDHALQDVVRSGLLPLVCERAVELCRRGRSPARVHRLATGVASARGLASGDAPAVSGLASSSRGPANPSACLLGSRNLGEIAVLYDSFGGADGGQSLVAELRARSDLWETTRMKLLALNSAGGVSVELYAAGPTVSSGVERASGPVMENVALDSLVDRHMRRMVRTDARSTLQLGRVRVEDCAGTGLSAVSARILDLKFRRFSFPIYGAGRDGSDLVLSVIGALSIDNRWMAV
jgi:hypothetical protein